MIQVLAHKFLIKENVQDCIILVGRLLTVTFV